MWTLSTWKTNKSQFQDKRALFYKTFGACSYWFMLTNKEQRTKWWKIFHATYLSLYQDDMGMYSQQEVISFWMFQNIQGTSREWNKVTNQVPKIQQWWRNHFMWIQQYCEEHEIKGQFLVDRTPQQNGVAKRKNRSVMEMARTMLNESKLNDNFLGQAVHTTVRIFKKGLLRIKNNKTPYELWTWREERSQHGKQTRVHFKKKEHSSTKPLELIHTDLCGPCNFPFFELY